MENHAVDEAFGRRVRDQRRRLDLSQREVAVTMGAAHDLPWHQTTVAKTETGERPAKLSEAVALAATFGVTLGELLDDQPVSGEERRARTVVAYRELAALQEYIRERRVRLGFEAHGVDLADVVSVDELNLEEQPEPDNG